MLPDFPIIKEKLKKLSNAQFKAAMLAYLGPFSDIPRSMVFEGDELIIVREDGSIESTPLTEMKVERQIDLTQVERMTPDIVRQHIDSAAKEMAIQQSKVLLEDLNKSIRKTGNLIDVGRRPFSIEVFFKALERIWIDFDGNGNPIMPTIVAGDKTSEAVAKVLREAESDPQCRARLKEIIEIKRMQWRDREANRKLVG
jgi:hypothetical protein